MNWDNQNKDPWGNKNDAPDFDELIKKFSSILGRKKSPSNGSGGGNKGGGFKFSSSRIFAYGFFAFLLLYGTQCIYQLDASERAVILRFGKFYEEQEQGLNFRLAGIDERYIEKVTLTRRYTQTNSMLTKDENIVDVTVSAQYRIANLKDFVLNVKDPIPDKIFLTQDDTQQFCSESNVQFYITRFNSLNTSKILSANDYSIKLSVDGNASTLQLEDEYLNNKNFKFKSN